MIGFRGKTKVMVLEPHGVPIQEIADAITNDHDMAWICNKYPITDEEVFEVIEVAADHLNNWKNSITLKNCGDEENIDLEATNVNSTMFFNILAYGRIQQETNDFIELFRIGLVALIEEIYTDINDESDAFMSSNIHASLYKALVKEIGDVDPTQVVEHLAESEKERAKGKDNE